MNKNKEAIIAFASVLIFLALFTAVGLLLRPRPTPILPERPQGSTVILAIHYHGPLDNTTTQRDFTDTVNAKAIYDVLSRHYSIRSRHPLPNTFWMGDVVWEINIWTHGTYPTRILLGRYSYHNRPGHQRIMYNIINPELLIEELEAIIR